ncbi:hypothetical protein BDV10DRAFT_182831 [Aspergillus recurvatus]
MNALSAAVRSGVVENVELLVKAEADVDKSDLLASGACQGDVEMGNFLLDNADGIDKRCPLAEAARYSHNEIVSLLPDEVADPDADYPLILLLARTIEGSRRRLLRAEPMSMLSRMVKNP